MNELLSFCNLIEKKPSFRSFHSLCLTQYTKIVQRNELYKLAPKIRGPKAFFLEKLAFFFEKPDFGHSGT